MTSTVLLLLFICLLLGGLLFLILLKRLSGRAAEDTSVKMIMELQREMTNLRGSIQDQVVRLSQQMNTQLEHNTRFLQDTHEQYSRAVGQVQHRLGELQEATHSMMAIGKDISSLQNILKAPKLRGGLGELFLGELLQQILPEDHFSLQYSFRDGRKVDAVIFLGQGMIPVDAKFPLENFQRILESPNDESLKQSKKSFSADVKKHVDDIASKYILPEEGTFDFALMYIPAENIYYETIIKDEMQPESISSYAIKKKVIPVSPNSFYAYLQAIVRGLKGLRIERSAQLILESLGQLEGDFKKCFDEFEKIGGHISNAKSSYDRALRRLERFSDRLSTIEDGQKRLPKVGPHDEIEQPAPSVHASVK
ncbi:MAG TPA: DNA recombination protein RmuC [bacterium]|nr:DNA recombination protein RmuC [bacterium]